MTEIYTHIYRRTGPSGSLGLLELFLGTSFRSSERSRKSTMQSQRVSSPFCGKIL